MDNMGISLPEFIYVFLCLILILSCVETNPGPNSNTSNSSIKPISIVHNNVCSLLPKVDIIANELSMCEIITINEIHLDILMFTFYHINVQGSNTSKI